MNYPCDFSSSLKLCQNMTKEEARIYNGSKIVSSLSAAGKSGPLHVKEEINYFPEI